MICICFALILFTSIPLFAADNAVARKPNVVFILADEKYSLLGVKVQNTAEIEHFLQKMIGYGVSAIKPI